MKYQVDIDDLRVYFKGNGCLYFLVFLSEDGSCLEIFYNSLYPSKIQFYLSFAEESGNRKKYAIPFIRLEPNVSRLERLCMQFAMEMIHQGSGRGQILSKTIKVTELKDVNSIVFRAVGAHSPYEILQGISTGDVVAYGTYEENGIEFPIGCGDSYIASMGQVIHDGVYVRDKKYYDGFTLECSVTAPGSKNYTKDGENSIFLSQNLRLGFNKIGITFWFEVNTDIMQISKDASFILDMMTSHNFFIGAYEMSFFKTDISDEFRQRLEGLREAGEALRDIGCRVLTPFKELNEEDKRQIDALINMRRGVKGFNTDEAIFVYNWTFQGKDFPFMLLSVLKGR